MAGSTGARAVTFRRLARGMRPEGTDRGKRELCRKKERKKNTGVEGRIVKNLASKTLSNLSHVTEMAQQVAF